MANVFRSKEVYKHLKYDLHNRKEIVAVQGVYVSGEYRPPYYNNPILRIYEINSNPARVDDFQDISRGSDEDSVVKILDFSTTINPLTITNYTAVDTSTGDDSVVKIIDFSATMLQPSMDFYKTINQNVGEDTVVKVLVFSVNTLQPTMTTYQTEKANMTPEPMLRLSILTSDVAVIENYT